MGRKANTLFFILGATAFNILVTLLGFAALFLLFFRLILPRFFPDAPVSWGFPVIFICSVVLSFFVYRWALKLFLKHFDADKNLGPLFRVKSNTRQT
jgi:hypothetical protein